MVRGIRFPANLCEGENAIKADQGPGGALACGIARELHDVHSRLRMEDIAPSGRETAAGQSK